MNPRALRSIRMSDQEWQTIKDAATVRGVSASELIRTALTASLEPEERWAFENDCGEQRAVSSRKLAEGLAAKYNGRAVRYVRGWVEKPIPAVVGGLLEKEETK